MAEDFDRAERLGHAEELTAVAARDILDGMLKRFSLETIESASIREHFQNWLESKKAEGIKESTAVLVQTYLKKPFLNPFS
jgi:hypothetical protein